MWTKFEQAMHFAIDAHAGMRRKGDGGPYIFHPIEAAAIASTMTEDEDVLCAAVLHDVVEDTPRTLDDVREAFGDRVAELVESETEDKRPDLPAEQTWLIRKQESIDELHACDDLGVKIIWLADKLSNMRSMSRMVEREGSTVWQRFHQSDPELHEWYYREVADATSCLSETRAWREFTKLIDYVFEGAEA